MRIIADEEATNLLTQLTDALLKAYGNKWLGLANQVLWKTENIKDFEISTKEKPKENSKKYKAEKQIEPKDIK